MERFEEGVLNSEDLRALQHLDVVRRENSEAVEAKGSALDLHLGTSGWLLRGSIKQIAEKRESVENVCKQYGKKFDVGRSGRIIKKGQVVIIKLQESVNFSQYPWFIGEATGKSSIGRLDVLTRLLVDRCPEYESIPVRYKGPLYVEIAPISFGIKIYEGLSLNQLRVHCGPLKPITSLVGRRLLFRRHHGTTFCAEAQKNCTLSLDISPYRNSDGSNLAAYCLRDKDLPALDLKKKGKANAKTYFEPIEAREDGSLIIAVNRFYILRSVERLCLPEDIAVTGMAYSESLGELRIHYAGFAHPWFGADREDKKIGTPLIFEVRAHSFPVVLRHGEIFAKINFYKMGKSIPNEDKEPEPSDYTNQELKLSNYFDPNSVP